MRRKDLEHKTVEYVQKNLVICADHFEQSQFMNATRKRLTKTAIPTVFSVPNPPKTATFSRKLPARTREPPKKKPKIKEDNSTKVSTASSEDSSSSQPSAQTSSSVSTVKSKKINQQKSMIYRQKRKIEALEKNLKKDKVSVEDILERTKELMSPSSHDFFATQLKLACRGKKWKKWSSSDKTVALTLFHCSPKAYRILRQIFNLPSVRCLQRTLKTINIMPGLNTAVLEGLKLKFESEPLLDKLCCLQIDEISLKCGVNYNMTDDCVEGVVDYGNYGKTQYFANHACVLLVSGLKNNWKQPIGYILSSDSTPSDIMSNMVLDAVRQLKAIGLIVKTLVSDMGSNNRKMYRNLGVTNEQPFFHCGDQKIHCFFDVPHLLKCTRNNLKKHDFTIDGLTIKWNYIRDFYLKDQVLPVRMAHKLKNIHFSLDSFASMRVSLAAQVFSRTVSAGIMTHATLGSLPSEAVHTANFVLKMNNLFDIMNSRCLRGDNFLRSAISEKSSHISMLRETLAWIDKWQVQDARSRPPSIDGWIQSIQALLNLWDELQNINMPFLITSRLQQDALENLFSVIRKRGGWCDNPMAHQFKAHLKSVMVSSLLKPTKDSNCEMDANKFLLTLNELKTKNNEGPSLCTSLLGTVNVQMNTIDPTTVPEEMLNVETYVETKFDNASSSTQSALSEQESHILAKNKVQTKQAMARENAMAYVGGYMIRQVLEKHECSSGKCKKILISSSPQFNNENQLFLLYSAYNKKGTDFGGLKVPSQELLKVLLVADKEFLPLFEEFLHLARIKQRIYYKLSTHFQELDICPDVREKFCNFFVSCRIYWAIRFLNRELNDKKMGLKKNRKLIKLKHM